MRSGSEGPAVGFCRCALEEKAPMSVCSQVMDKITADRKENVLRGLEPEEPFGVQAFRCHLARQLELE